MTENYCDNQYLYTAITKTANMEIPKPGAGKVVLLAACAATGHVLNNDGSLYAKEGNNHCRIIDNQEEAEQIALREIKLGLTELALYDDQGNYARTYRPPRPVTRAKDSRPGSLALDKLYKYKSCEQLP